MSGRQHGKRLEPFVAGTTARAAALLVEVQANTAIALLLPAGAPVDRQQAAELCVVGGTWTPMSVRAAACAKAGEAVLRQGRALWLAC